MNAQRDLFVRGSATSKAAADAIRPERQKKLAQVYDWLRLNGPATDEEMQDGIPMSPNTQRPRRVELVALGRVYATTDRRQTRAGREATVWAAR